MFIVTRDEAESDKNKIINLQFNSGYDSNLTLKSSVMCSHDVIESKKAKWYRIK